MGSLAGLELYCSAEGYYLAGRFQPLAAKSDTPQAAASSWAPNVEPELAGSQPPRDDATAVLALPSDPAPEPVAETSDPLEPTSEVMAAASPAAEPESTAATEEPPPVNSSAEAATQETAAEIAQLAPPPSAEGTSASADAAEVLPPPAAEKEPRSSVPEFGAFADEPSSRAPSRTPRLPATIALPGERTYRDAPAYSAGRYAGSSDLVRERALERGEQRRQRIEIRKWLGISPLRPSVSANPYTSVEEPQQLILVVPHVAAKVQP